MREQVVMEWGLLDRLCGDQPEFMHRLITLYIEDAQKDRAELGTACDNQDWAGVARAAHRMHGAAKTMGALRVALASGSLHAAAAAAEAARCSRERAHVEQELEALLPILQARLSTLPKRTDIA